MSAHVNALMLGGRGYGKTCFMAGMYNAMSYGVNGFLLTSSDFDQRLKLDQFWTGIASGRCPDGTLEGEDLRFDCAYAFDPIMEVSWYDYPGGWINPTSSADRDNYEQLLNRINTADFVMCCLPADQLLEAYNTKRQLHCFQQYNNLFIEYAKRKPDRFPSVMYVITKADLVVGSESVIHAIDFFVSRSPFRGERWPEISVVPVSLGLKIAIEGQQILTLDALDPLNIHVPVLYAIVKKLDLLIKDALCELEDLEEMISNKNIDLGNLKSGFLSIFREGKITSMASRIDELDQERIEMSRKCEELAQQVEQVNRELASASPVIYRDGKRSK